VVGNESQRIIAKKDIDGVWRVPAINNSRRVSLVSGTLLLSRCLCLNSPNRDGGSDIDIALDRIRVGTDGVGALDKLFRRLMVDAGHGHGERDG
jgi:hypothetical protein